MARLKPGATVERAQAELSAIAANMQTDRPPTATRWSARSVPLQIDKAGNARPLLWILIGAVGLLMMITCVNVASLLLARGAERETDVALRVALGGSRLSAGASALPRKCAALVGWRRSGLLLAPVVTRVLMAAAPATVADAWSHHARDNGARVQHGDRVRGVSRVRHRAGHSGGARQHRGDAARIRSDERGQSASDTHAQCARRLPGGDRAGAPRGRGSAAPELRASALGSIGCAALTGHDVRGEPADGTLPGS